MPELVVLAMAQDERPLSRRNRALITGGVVAGLLGGGAYLRSEKPEDGISPREVAQQKADAEARRRFAEAGMGLDEPLAAPPVPAKKAAPAVTEALESCELVSGAVISKDLVRRSWESVRQSARTADDFEKAVVIMLDIKKLFGKKDVTTAKDLTEQDFAQFGIKRDEYLTLLDETAMTRARESLKQANQMLYQGDAYAFLSDASQMLRYTNYPTRDAALSALCAMQPECGSPEKFESRLKSLAGTALAGTAQKFKEKGFENDNLSILTYKGIHQMILDSGQDPKDDVLMKGLLGMTHAEFLQKAQEKYQETMKNLWGDRIAVNKASNKGPSCP